MTSATDQAMTPPQLPLPIERILEMLPHRYPLLLIDRIVEIELDKSAVAIKNVSFNEPQFQGHFPRHPVMPGVLLIEAMAQTAAALVVADAAPDLKAGVEMARHSIDSGAARDKITQVARITQTA
mgnify:CR=1 FL=1